MVRHPTEVVQFGSQPHVWRPCLRRSPVGERGVQGRTGQQTGPNERPGQGRVFSDQHNRRADEARRGQVLRNHDLPSSTNNQGTNSTNDLPSFFATSQQTHRTLSLPTNDELSNFLTLP